MRNMRTKFVAYHDQQLSLGIYNPKESSKQKVALVPNRNLSPVGAELNGMSAEPWTWISAILLSPTSWIIHCPRKDAARVRPSPVRLQLFLACFKPVFCNNLSIPFKPFFLANSTIGF